MASLSLQQSQRQAQLHARLAQAAITLAQREAEKAVKLALKGQGLKPQYIGTAAVTPSVLVGGYAVQVTSERSESGAQAAFRALQAKYPIQLNGRHPVIRRADLGAAGSRQNANPHGDISEISPFGDSLV